MLLQIDRITVNMQANSRRKLDPVHVQYALMNPPSPPVATVQCETRRR